MTSDKVERYCGMLERLKSLVTEAEITALMDSMDTLWYLMSPEEATECERRLSQEGGKPDGR